MRSIKKLIRRHINLIVSFYLQKIIKNLKWGIFREDKLVRFAHNWNDGILEYWNSGIMGSDRQLADPTPRRR
jgi:hypothetical protein